LVSFKKRFVLLMKGTPNKVRTLHTDVSMAANAEGVCEVGALVFLSLRILPSV
jgi:hypothetical protein